MHLFKQFYESHFNDKSKLPKQDPTPHLKYVVDTLGNLITIPLFYHVIGFDGKTFVSIPRTDPQIITRYPILFFVSHTVKADGNMFFFDHERNAYVRGIYRDKLRKVGYYKQIENELKAIDPQWNNWLYETVEISENTYMADNYPNTPSFDHIFAFQQQFMKNYSPLSLSVISFLNKLLGANTATGYIRTLYGLVNSTVSFGDERIFVNMFGVKLEFTFTLPSLIKITEPPREGHYRNVCKSLSNKRTNIASAQVVDYDMIESLHFVISLIGNVNTRNKDFPLYLLHELKHDKRSVNGYLVYPTLDEYRLLCVKYSVNLEG